MYVSQMSVVIDLKVILKKKKNNFNNKKGENSRTEKCHIKKKKILFGLYSNRKNRKKKSN